jgi:hypothetical protein
MDSLMAVELKGRLEAGLGHALPATVAFEYPTVEALAAYLARDVLALELSETSGEASPADEAQHDEAAEELERFSEEELIALLANELEAIEQGRTR